MHLNPTVISAFQDAAQTHGIATGGSRLVQGRLQPIAELEEQLCAIDGSAAALTFASGLLANIGFGHAFTRNTTLGPGCALDLSDAVFVLDRDCHWSIHKSVERLRGEGRLFVFRHNDMNDLQSTLKRLVGKRIIIVFESIYSADGSIAPINDILALAREVDALTYVDDANGYLIYGPSHRPYRHEFSAIRHANLHMVSFSKAVGLEGGAISGGVDAIHILEWLSGTSSFTSTMLPPLAAAACIATSLIQENPQIVDSYLKSCSLLRRHLKEEGYMVSPSESYITNVHIGADDIAEAVRRSFLDRGLLVPVFRYPAVPKGQAGLRLMPSALHTESHMEQFLNALKSVRAKHRF